MKQIKEGIKTDLQSCQILTQMQIKDLNLCIKAQEVYNAKVQIQREVINLMTTIQALINHFEHEHESAWFVWYKINELKQIIHFMFSSSVFWLTLQANNQVLIMNVMHKINIHNLPLLVITEIIVINTSFYTAFSFQMSKNEEDFIQSL